MDTFDMFLLVFKILVVIFLIIGFIWLFFEFQTAVIIEKMHLKKTYKTTIEELEEQTANTTLFIFLKKHKKNFKKIIYYKFNFVLDMFCCFCGRFGVIFFNGVWRFRFFCTIKRVRFWN